MSAQATRAGCLNEEQVRPVGKLIAINRAIECARLPS